MKTGAIVTIYGKGFGVSQKSSTVLIGGKDATYIYYWGNSQPKNKAGETYNSLYDSHGMQEISVQIPAGADSTGLSITVDGYTSNVIPFTIRSGDIYFVDDSAVGIGTGSYLDPWQSPASYMTKLASGVNGAICYFREGVYANTEYANITTGSNALFYINSSHAGTETNPNALVAYPGEVTSLEATEGDAKEDPGYFIGILQSYPYNSGQWITLAGFRAETNTQAVVCNTGCRVVGNLFIGATVFNSGTALVIAKSHVSHINYPERELESALIYGNVITGETTQNKLNHSLYVGSSKNTEIAWNYSYNMNFGIGPHISCNDENAVEEGFVPIVNGRIHHNFIDMSSYPSRAFGTADLANESDITYHNNIIVGPTAPNVGIGNFKSGEIKMYNNTFYNVGGNYNAAVFDFIYNIKGGYTMSVDLQNNIFHATGGTSARYMNI